MKNLVVKIQTLDEWRVRAASAMKAVVADETIEPVHGISFPTYDAMHATLSPARVEIVMALAGKGKLSTHEVASRVGRDVQAVEHDITRLVNGGIIERDDEGVRYDYDGLEFAFKVPMTGDVSSARPKPKNEKPVIALEADPNDPEDFDVTEEDLEKALAERRERLKRSSGLDKE